MYQVQPLALPVETINEMAGTIVLWDHGSRLLAPGRKACRPSFRTFATPCGSSSRIRGLPYGGPLAGARYRRDGLRLQRDLWRADASVSLRGCGPDRQSEHSERAGHSLRRGVSALFAGFSILALVLSAVGLYSVSSYSVAQRTNEFGIRVALGAQRAHVFRIVMASASVLSPALC